MLENGVRQLEREKVEGKVSAVSTDQNGVRILRCHSQERQLVGSTRGIWIHGRKQHHADSRCPKSQRKRYLEYTRYGRSRSRNAEFEMLRTRVAQRLGYYLASHSSPCPNCASHVIEHKKIKRHTAKQKTIREANTTLQREWREKGTRYFSDVRKSYIRCAVKGINKGHAYERSLGDHIGARVFRLILREHEGKWSSYRESDRRNTWKMYRNDL